jgi:Transposase DDE domain
MDSLPSALTTILQTFQPLMRHEVFISFGYLLTGLLIGEAKAGTARASVFAPADYWPQRLSDLFCRHKLSGQALMAHLAAVALALRYPHGLPQRLFWLADATYTEKPYAQHIASVDWFHRLKHVAGRAKNLKGHCYVFAAHLYRGGEEKVRRQWASVLVGALLYVKGRSIPTLVGALAQQLRLPSTARHVWVTDSGILSRPLLRALDPQGHFALGRLRCNQRVYFAPRRRSPRQRRPRVFGQSCRVDRLLPRSPQRVREHQTVLRVRGRERAVAVCAADILLRGVWPHRALPARVAIVSVPGLSLAPWYLLCTDLTLDPVEMVLAYAGRCQIEVNFDEVKELGLGHYQGRSGQGVRRWPLFLCVAHLLLKFLATGVLSVPMPNLNWSWYPRENTVGQVRRRLIELCRPRISRDKPCAASVQEFANAA